MIGMPLIGWGMLSEAAYPVVLFRGWHLPAILPQSDSVHTLLWDAHFHLAFAFFALILLHVAPCSTLWFDAMACLKRWPPYRPGMRSRPPSEIAWCRRPQAR